MGWGASRKESRVRNARRLSVDVLSRDYAEAKEALTPALSHAMGEDELVAAPEEAKVQ